VGASASGVQIADELNRAGRQVSIAVGRHTRMPRRYRGMDVYWWLDRLGRLAQTIDSVSDPVAARREPSAQLVAHSELDRSVSTLDLGTLHAAGVRLLGRFEGIEGSVARFRTDLETTLAASDAAMSRFLDAVDAHVERCAPDRHVWGDDRPTALTAPRSADRLDLRHEGITSIVLATGLRPDFSFLEVPVVGADGSVVQRRGATAAPGLYVVGQRFQHRRDSASISGAKYDAADVVAHLERSRGRTLQLTGEERAS
jgi:putative flavoprotein involved in K+ transport